MSRYWGIADSAVSFCPKLFGNCNLQGLVLRELLKNYNLHVVALCQAVGNSNLQGIVLPQAIEGLLYMMYLKHAPHVARLVPHIS